jgi:two-component system, cell cycle sensor histidine kinase and response regulator CckA
MTPPESTKANRRLSRNEALRSDPSWSLSIVESARDAIITVDAGQRILVFNRAAEEMFRCSAKDALGHSIERLLPERFRGIHKQHIVSFGETGVTTRSMGGARAISGLRSNGEEFPIEASISQVEVNGQRLFTVIMRDITARKRAEEERAYMAAIVESSDDAIISKTLDGVITGWNRGAERLYGYSRAEAIGRSIEIIFPTDRQEELHQILDQLKKGEGVIRQDTVRRNKDGASLEVSVTVSPIRDPAGRVVGASTIARDVTESKRIEREMRQQAELLNLAPVLVRDLNDRITLWTKGAERLYGFSPEEALGQISHDLLKTQFPEGREAVNAKLDRTGTWEGELIHQNRDGRQIVAASHQTVYRNIEGSRTAILEINTDLTEQKKIESQLLRAQRMESIGTLAGGIAHDLNNILAPIMMAVEILGMEVTSNKGREFLEMLSANAERGSNMIRQVLSFARGVEGKRVIVQPAHIIKELTKVLKETIPRSIDIQFDLPRELWAVSADPTQIHQLLMNLCVNARDAMPNGGSLSIRAENRTIDENYARMNVEAQAGEFVKISVADTGTGIDAAVIDRIFEPFFTTKGIGQGTGLGLSTVSTISKSHGGFMNVYSEVGKGTEITIYLPACKEVMEQPLVARARDLPVGHGELVLVVDDEEAIREITKGTLEAFGYRVLLAGDGTEALGVYAENKEAVRVVITDMMMPYMDGLATIRALRKMSPNVKVISTSGLADNAKAAEVARAGVHSFLPKPYTAEQLLRTLAEIIQNP